ncbi:MAG: DUF1624 domain-containing protein [Chloroflexota bacterium]|nr:MAG: DUF1624 domain-containing protein [Chloroflexota bacterium]
MDGRSRAFDSPRRLQAVDALRGLIIILMALDHANHFVAQEHSPGEYWGGVFLAYSETLPFLTRLVTHLAAPGFFFLMGVGMILYANSRTQAGQNRRRIMSHFLVRGALLIALQFLVVNRAWELSPGGWGLEMYVGVLFALGSAMIVSSLLIWLKSGYLIVLAGALLVGTELIHPDPATWNQVNLTVFERLFIHPTGDRSLWSNYPVLPWLELAVLGLAYGHWLTRDSKRTFRWGAFLGVGLLVLFVLLRAVDGFGNIRPRAGSSWIDFLNVVKYPPSLTFTFLTMGVNMIALGLLSRIAEKRTILLQPLVVYGRTPLFFYLVHLFLYAGLGRLFTPEGTTIPGMIPYWLLGLVILYPLCFWFSRVRSSRPAGSPIRYI